MTSGQQEPAQQRGNGTVRTDYKDSPEQAIVRLEEELALAKKKVQIVGSTTRHDILNQMTAIMGYNELLLTMVQDQNIRNFLEIEQRASDKIRRIFAFSKVFQLMGTEPPRWQKIGALVRLACDELDLGKVAIHDETGDTSLFTEPQIFKVFSYLFDNAIRHGKKTTEIRLELRRDGPDPVLIIQDDGEGIPAENKEKIFERGFGKYTGWGLFVAREILAVNSLTIRETGTAGEGARFEITIPEDRIRGRRDSPVSRTGSLPT